MRKKECIEDSYIYFARHKTFYSSNDTLNYWRNWWLNQGYSKEDVDDWIMADRQAKVGETASYTSRSKKLYSENGMRISRRVKFLGTKDERLFVESYVRLKYSTNSNMRHHGNDYFTCANTKTIKGAENKFFEYVAEGFALMSALKGKKYSYECEIMRNC